VRSSRERRLAAAERYVRDLLDGGSPTALILSAICKLVEAEDTEAVAGITVLDAEGGGFERAVFPALTPDFSAAIITVKVRAPFTGSCVKAAVTRETITVPDIAATAEFDPVLTKLCLDSGLKSLQSMPIVGDDGRSLGTFVIGYREICAPSRFDLELAGFGARLTGVVLDKSQRLPLAPYQVEVAQAAE
jgi:hypothetical protein